MQKENAQWPQMKNGFAIPSWYEHEQCIVIDQFSGFYCYQLTAILTSTRSPLNLRSQLGNLKQFCERTKKASQQTMQSMKFTQQKERTTMLSSFRQKF